MKKKMNLSNHFYWVLSMLIVLGIASCKKQSANLIGGTGAPTISSVKTLNQSKVDSTKTKSVTVYNSAGVATTTTTPDYSLQVTAFDSTTATGKLNNYYVLTGTNLASTIKIAINGVSIYFNPAFSSDNSVIFQIPTTVPYVQPQPNTIVVTTLHGAVTYTFTTLPPAPTIVTASTNDFQAGTSITLTGKGFASVSSVKLRTTNDQITIVTQNDSTLVLKMPAKSTATQSALLFTYTSGSNTAAQTASTLIFNDLDNAAFQVFTDNFGSGVYGTAWGTQGVSTSVSQTGTSSFYVIYPKGNYWIGGWGFNVPLTNSYKTLTMWVKGGGVSETLYFISAQGNSGGFTNQDRTFSIVVPPSVWTYFTINVASTDMFQNGSSTSNFGFWIAGPGSQDETIYFDDVVFWK
jgi:hypothetical protein